MASVFDAAAYILKLRLPKEPTGISTWKLQKLVYYSQAWSTVWDDDVLFAERIEAWANGPVSPDLYAFHKGHFKITSLPKGCGKIGSLTRVQKETIDAVVDHYGKRTAHYLSALTHSEKPWKDARRGIPEGERSNAPITPAAMANYYGNL